MKTMRRALSIGFVLCLLATISIFAADSGFRQFDSALGFQVGQLSGLGLSYQKWEGDTGYQLAFGALYFPLDETDFWSPNILNYTIGAELQHTVYGDDFANWLSGRLYLFSALNHRGYIEAEMVSSDPYVLGYGDFNAVFAFGVGIGIEIILFKHFSFPVELGRVFGTPTKSGLRDQFVVDIVPQVGFRYRY